MSREESYYLRDRGYFQTGPDNNDKIYKATVMINETGMKMVREIFSKERDIRLVDGESNVNLDKTWTFGQNEPSLSQHSQFHMTRHQCCLRNPPFAVACFAAVHWNFSSFSSL
jgi:hypothetical protein